MNRKESRKQKRADERRRERESLHNPTLHLKREEAKAVIEKMSQQRIGEIEAAAINHVLNVTAHSLAKLHKFGEKRLNEFIDEVILQYECLMGNFVKIKEIEKELMEKYNLKIRVKCENAHRDKNDYKITNE